MAGKRKSDVNSWLQSRTGLVLLAFLAIAGFFLVTEHTAHFFSVLPYALLFLCPLLHLFMHGGHGEHASHVEHGGHSYHLESERQRPEGGEQ